MPNNHFLPLYTQGRTAVLKLLRDQKQAPEEVQVRSLADAWLKSQKLLLTPKFEVHLIDSIVYAIVGFGPLEFLLRDPAISEIMVNGPHEIFVEKAGQLEKTNLQFVDEDQLLQVINRIVAQVGRRIDESSPLVDARLHDGSRVNAIIAPLSLMGPVLNDSKIPHRDFHAR